ncbi:ATP-dependent nuclease [Methanosarcina mazei]|uniref:Putative exonuclease n=1 Tax=Methanosarcina mazei SarPi TaxID=1434115 RepID=A0A0E3R7X1_METMZ|nr:AAA family ATPase [Methanosarcina mazei]AKB61177.1 putative exonuclease [Methanosarcina mazei SarPi]
MIIKKLKIKNFRCFGSKETVIEFENLTTIIGANSSGKTAILDALLKLFGRNGEERDIKISDFHVPKDKRPEEIVENELYIEAIIHFPELVNDKDWAEKTIPDLFNRMVVDKASGDPYVRIRLEALWKKSNLPEGDIECDLLFITNSEEDEITDEKRYPAKVSEIRSNIQMIYVPAIREPSYQLRNASGTILWRMFNGINWPEDINKKISEKTEPINSIFDNQAGIKQIQEIIGTQWSSFHRDQRYTQAKIKFISNDLDDILDRASIEFSPTEIPKSYSINTLGEGLRSLFYFSLVNSLLEVEYLSQKGLRKKDNGAVEEEKIFNLSPPVLTILAVEEPENHIAPQLLGRVIDNIDQIARKNNAQVILTSHSPSIVKRVETESIRYVRLNKENLCTHISKILLPKEQDEIYKYIKEAVTSYPEIYFARLVVLGEGDSEEIIIPKAIGVLDSKFDSCGISIVPLGGRFVNHFWKLLTDLDIPFITLLDLDSEREGGGWGRIKYVIEQLLENGYNLEEIFNFEEAKHLKRLNLESMHKWPLETLEDRVKLMKWVEYLEDYGVFFSDPLDLDFSMLKAFTNNYQNTAPINGGPRIPDKVTDPTKYKIKMETCIRYTLKESGGDGNTFDNSEKELMLWYPYLFLDRGKPGTHILAMTELDNELFKSNMPTSLIKLVQAINTKLKDDPFSSSDGLNI